MAEPAEVLLIKDQYESAFHALSRGLSAEEAGLKAEALKCYRKGLHHLTQGLAVPTVGAREQGPSWDKARQLQQKMRETLQTATAHIYELETDQPLTKDQWDSLLTNQSQNSYPDLGPISQPPNSSLHHLYPTVPATNQRTTPVPLPRPLTPSVSKLTATAIPAIAMASQADQPPAYTPQPTHGHRRLDYGLASGALAQNERELLHIPAGVQMFFVAPSGQVSSLLSPGFLRIVTFDSQEKNSDRPSAFLQVCEWLYPLTPDTPVLLANTGIFMFPDTLAEAPGSFVGIVLSSELPAADREVFQDILSQLVQFRLQGPAEVESDGINLNQKVPLLPPKEETTSLEKEKVPLPGWSEKMAQRILSGTTWLSQEFGKGADVTSRSIHKSGYKIRDRITPEETPSEVSPRVTKGLQVAQKTTGGAVRATQLLVDGLSSVAGRVAEKIAPQVKKHGPKLVPESMKKSNDGRPSNLDGAKHVAVSGVKGLSTLWSSLESGAKLVGKSVAAETVTTVKYKYGEDAGEATESGLKSVANVGVAAYNIDHLGLKVIVNTTNKQGGPTEEADGTKTPTQSLRADTEAKDTPKK